MYEASKEYDRQRRAVVFDKLPDVKLEEVAMTNYFAQVGSHQNEKSNHDRQVCRCVVSQIPLTSENLDAFLEVDESDVEAKYITAESSHVRQRVASICYGKYPMHDQ